MKVSEAMLARRSVRGFLEKEVPAEVLSGIFSAAQQAPSWCNIQPWRVWVTRGTATTRVTAALVAAAQSAMPEPDVPFPGEYPPPYDQHRKDCGRALYEAMGVARDDKAARWDAWLRNFSGFGAPHLAFVAMDRRFGTYGALDVGCWLESVLLLATEAGLGTCAQAALATYPGVLRRELGIGDELAILCGIAIGYEDGAVPANACRTARAPVGANVTLVER